MSRRKPGLIAAAIVALLGGGLGFLTWELSPPTLVFDQRMNPAVVSGFHGNADSMIGILEMKLFPFTGYHGKPELEDDGVFRGIHYRLKTNQLGFLTPYEFDAVHPAPFRGHGRTKVVLVTGGSAAWGLGASSNDHILANQLEAMLRKAEPQTDWRVVNLAMEGWNAFQEFVALDMYGAGFDPDWVVTFDGRNDVMVGMQQGEEVPGYFLNVGERRLSEILDGPAPWERLGAWQPVLRYYQFLAKVYAVGLAPDPKRDLETMHSALNFYYSSLAAIRTRFPNSKTLFVTQPTGYAHIPDESLQVSRMPAAYDELVPRVRELARNHRDSYYLNADAMFDIGSWDGFFADDCHMRDVTHEKIARQIADLILGKSS